MVFCSKQEPGADEKRLTPGEAPVLRVVKSTMQVWTFSDDEAAFAQFAGIDEAEYLPDDERVHVGRTDPDSNEFVGDVRVGIQGSIAKESIVLAPGIGVYWKER